MHIIAGKAAAFGEALKPEFKEYQTQILKNAKAMSEKFVSLGVKLVSGGTDNHLMLLDLSDRDITGKELEMLGLVRGSTIQSKNIGKDIAQSFKTIVGGELKAYTEMMNEARAVATDRMVAEAEGMGADAVVNIRYASSSVMQGAAEVIAYGTAVRFIVK